MGVRKILSQEELADRKKYRNLLYMGIFIFLISFGEGITAPAIPIYGDRLGASYVQLGFLMTGYSITYTLMSLAAGRFSDKVGRKPLLLVSILLSITAAAGYYLAAAPLTLLIFRTIEGMSRGILWPVAEAIMADNTSRQERGRAMGRFTGAYGAGATLGNLVGGNVMQFIGVRAVFPVYPVLGVIVLITSLIGITEVTSAESGESGAGFSSDGLSGESGAGSSGDGLSGERSAKGEVDGKGLSGEEAAGGELAGQELSLETLEKVDLREEFKKIWPICYIGFAYAGFLYSVQGLLSQFANVLEVALLGIGVIYGIFWGMRTVAFLACGELVGIIGRKSALLIGIGFSILSTGTFLFADGFRPLVFAALLGGIGTGLMFPLSLTLIADNTSLGTHGFGMGALEFTMGIGMIIQTALSGILGDFGGVRFTYLFTFIVTVIAVPVTLKFIFEPEAETEVEAETQAD